MESDYLCLKLSLKYSPQCDGYHLCFSASSVVHKGGVFKLRVEYLKDIEESLIYGSLLSAQI